MSRMHAWRLSEERIRNLASYFLSLHIVSLPLFSSCFQSLAYLFRLSSLIYGSKCIQIETYITQKNFRSKDRYIHSQYLPRLSVSGESHVNVCDFCTQLLSEELQFTLMIANSETLIIETIFRSTSAPILTDNMNVCTTQAACPSFFLNWQE